MALLSKQDTQTAFPFAKVYDILYFASAFSHQFQTGVKIIFLRWHIFKNCKQEVQNRYFLVRDGTTKTRRESRCWRRNKQTLWGYLLSDEDIRQANLYQSNSIKILYEHRGVQTRRYLCHLFWTSPPTPSLRSLLHRFFYFLCSLSKFTTIMDLWNFKFLTRTPDGHTWPCILIQHRIDFMINGTIISAKTQNMTWAAFLYTSSNHTILFAFLKCFLGNWALFYVIGQGVFVMDAQ